MKTQVILGLLGLLLPVAFSSCQLLYPGEGEILIEQIPVHKVLSLTVDDVFDVYIIPDTINTFYIEAGENQMKTIKTTYDSVTGQLTIDNEVSFRVAQGYRRIKATLHADSIRSVEFTVAGGLYFMDTLAVPNFRFASRGDMGNAEVILKSNSVEIENVDTNGRYIFRGKTNKLTVFNRGLSIVDARDLVAMETEIGQYSLGDCHVKATSKLRYSIYRNGNVYQHGQLQDVQGTIFGTGSFFIIN